MEGKSSKKKNHTQLKDVLRSEIITKMSELELWKDGLLIEIPTYWDNFGNFVIFNSKFFVDECWSSAGSPLWECVSKTFGGKSVALQGRINDDDFRSPNAKVVFGASPWVEYLDNGIKYTWNVECTMFCSGNVSERHRIATFDCANKIVVDMFAGIGYFTLPYLIHARAKKVIACEWNPVSVQALQTNLRLNKVADVECAVLEGDVRTECPRGEADHINLGLIPSCEQYWPTAAEILKSSGGVLHVHENVTSHSRVQDFLVQCKECLSLLQGLSIDIFNFTKENASSNFGVSFNEGNVVVESNLELGMKWKKIEWFVWGIHTSHSFCKLLSGITKTKWTVTPQFLHRVKAYAPHIDHLVLDISCLNLLENI